MTHFYNDFEPAAAASIRQAIADGLIPAGAVTETSITELQPHDIGDATQAHFFAGAGGWAYAARLAGWPEHWPLWSGSAPCQPFSQAGKGLGVKDSRHLWPDFYRLICARRPAVCAGEQVAGKAGVDWFHGVRSDLVAAGYSVRMVVSPAASVNAPHLRERIYWWAIRGDVANPGHFDGRRGPCIAQDGQEFADIYGSALGDADGLGRSEALGKPSDCAAEDGQRPANCFECADSTGSNFWHDHDWIICHDGKARRIPQSRICVLADGLSTGVREVDPSRLLVPAFKGRIPAWKIAGNSIVIPQAVAVLQALMETMIEDYGWSLDGRTASCNPITPDQSLNAPQEAEKAVEGVGELLTRSTGGQ